MDPQHFMLCSSWVVAERQSANCKPNKATIDTTMSRLLRIFLISTLSGLDAGVNKLGPTRPFARAERAAGCCSKDHKYTNGGNSSKIWRSRRMPTRIHCVLLRNIDLRSKVGDEADG